MKKNKLIIIGLIAILMLSQTGKVEAASQFQGYSPAAKTALHAGACIVTGYGVARLVYAGANAWMLKKTVPTPFERLFDKIMLEDWAQNQNITYEQAYE